MATVVAPAGRGPERAQAQRERILAAAKTCFIDHGFHAASMGDIAHQAGMSPGLIYRYYESKSAIIVAIMARQLEESLENIRKLNADTDFAETVFSIYTQWRDREGPVMNPALFAEMSAEATRDAAVAAALRNSDRAIRQELCHVVRTGIAKAAGQALPDAVIEQRALALQTFFEGLAMRAMREPDLDPALMRATIAAFFGMLYKAAE